MRRFYFFCSQTGITPTFPIGDEDILINFSECMARSVQHRSIRHKTLRFQSWLCPMRSSFSSLPILSLWNKALPGSWFQSSETHNMAHIRFILPPLKCHLSFFGFLIIGELTCDSHLNPERHSTVPDLVFVPKSSPKFKLVGLKVSKKRSL